MPQTSETETNKSGFDPAGAESLLDVNECCKNVLMPAEAQGVHEAEGHGVGTPAEAALGSVELWNVGRNAQIRCSKSLKLLKARELESTEVRSQSRLMTGTTRPDFQADGSETQKEVEERAEDDATVGKRP